LNQKENSNTLKQHSDKKVIKSLNEILECVENFKIIYVKIYNSEIISPMTLPSTGATGVFGNDHSRSQNITFVSSASIMDKTNEYQDLLNKEIGCFRVVMKIN
tara:strand:+ start:530 stop:838 length:309 start_codon:yes stop_codon:yes gene_type:complete